MMTEVTRRIEFDAAHRVLRHEGKCKHLHGHRYVCEVTIRAPRLDDLGRVVDFGCVKQLVGGWVDQHWDHNALLNEEDPLLDFPPEATLWAGRRPYIFSGNPTAENIAEELYRQAKALLPPDLTVTRVRVYETPNCYADYTP